MLRSMQAADQQVQRGMGAVFEGLLLSRGSTAWLLTCTWVTVLLVVCSVSQR
jgi:hypothetical protein